MPRVKVFIRTHQQPVPEESIDQELSGVDGVNSQKLNDWLQIIGMFGLVLSLIFVGLQLRQSQNIALSAAYQARAQMSVDISLVSSSTPEFTSASAKLYVGEANRITPEELVALEYNFGANVATFENNHYQYESGFLPEEHWQKVLDDMHCLFSHELYRRLLGGWDFRESFQKVVDERMEYAEKNPSSCWTAVVLPGD